MIFIMLFIFFVWLISRILGGIGYAIYKEKGRTIGRILPWIYFCVFLPIYNTIEYLYVRHQVTTFCQKEAGIFVYVTPEQWREQNKNELDGLYQFGNIYSINRKKWRESQEQEKIIKREYPTFVYENNEYKNLFIYNERIVQYRRREKTNYFVSKLADLTVDIKTGQVLAKALYNNSGVSGFMSVNRWADLKEWMNNIPNCRYIGEQFIDLSSQFSNPSLQKGTEQ